jgi:hypothetical protein
MGSDKQLNQDQYIKNELQTNVYKLIELLQTQKR